MRSTWGVKGRRWRRGNGKRVLAKKRSKRSRRTRIVHDRRKYRRGGGKRRSQR